MFWFNLFGSKIEGTCTKLHYKGTVDVIKSVLLKTAKKIIAIMKHAVLKKFDTYL